MVLLLFSENPKVYVSWKLENILPWKYFYTKTINGKEIEELFYGNIHQNKMLHNFAFIVWSFQTH